MNSKQVTVQNFYTVTDEELMLTSSQNPEFRFERNADGTLETMPPTGGISGNREIKAGAYLFNWVESQNLGEVFGPSTGFRLANTAVRSPDAAFVAKGRLPDGWDEQEDAFINLAPDFLKMTVWQNSKLRWQNILLMVCDWDG